MRKTNTKTMNLRRCLHLLGAWVAIVSLLATVCHAEPKVEDIIFRATVDASEQRYVRVLPTDFDPQQKHDVLVTLHGHGSDRWQFVRQPRDECKGARDIAAQHRMILISPDYRAATSWMGPLAEADMVQILAEVKSQFAVRHVIISGGSMGGTGSLTFAALHPELVDGVVALNGTANLLEYKNFTDAITASFGGPKTKIPLEYKRRSAEYWPERLTMPVACTTGGQDRSVPPDSVLRLVDVLKTLDRPVLLIHRERGGHSTNYDDTLQAYEFVLNKLAEAKR